MKKLLAIVISMAMIVAMMPIGVFAAEETVVHVKSIEEFNNALSNTTGQNINIRLEEDLVNVGKVIVIENGKNITIDMNGKNISFSSKKHFTVKNGTLEFKGTGTVSEAEPYFGPVILNGGSQQTETNHSNVIVGENITLRGWSALFIDQNKGSNYGINATVNGKLEGLADTSGDKGSGIYINGQIAATTGAVPNIKIGSTATIESVGDGIYAAGYAKWNIEGAKITGATGIEIRAGELTVSENTEITGTSAPKTVTPNGNGSTTDGAGIAIAQHTTGLPIDVKIISGDIKGFSALYESNPQKNSVENIAKVKIAVSGGNFTAIKGGTNAIYSEDKKNFITGGTYSDLSAVDYLGESANVTIKLGKDATKDVAILADCTATIDLNGNKITNSGSHTIVNRGTLTIEDTSENKAGTVDNVTHGKAALVNYGTAILNGGTYTRSLEDEENNKDSAGKNSFYTILNDKGGNMTIKNGVNVTNKGHFSSMIRNGGDSASQSASKLKINGGSFSGGINTVKNDELGELTVSGGSFSNTSQFVIMNWHKANLSGGSFEANDSAEAVLFTAKYAENRAVGELTVTGGTYISKDNQKVLCDRYDNSEKYKGTATITGGTFSSDPSAYVASGYYADKSGDAWTVRPVPYTPSTPTDNVTNNPADKNTTADLTPAVKDNKAETTVDAKTADKIVEKALENKSEEIIVDAAGNNTVASSEVGIPEKTVKEIAEKTDANLVIKTDNGKVDLDKTALAAVAAQAGTTGTVRLVVETVKTDENICHVELKLITSNGAVKDFRGGNVKVTINLDKELAAKDVVCVYINDNGIYTLVDGVLNADGTYTFTTGHFSEYAVMAKAEADKKIAEQLNTLIKEVNLKVRTSKTSKKNIKAVVSGDVKALTDAGYTVKYKFYRSEKKASKYEAKATKAGKIYINTAGKKGTKYYYKAKALVYDGDKLVGQTVLTQCKYGVRTWSK